MESLWLCRKHENCRQLLSPIPFEGIEVKNRTDYELLEHYIGCEAQPQLPGSKHKAYGLHYYYASDTTAREII